jgi:hypothetical protein
LGAATVAVLLLSATGPAAAFALTRAAGPAGAPLVLAVAEGCQVEPPAPAESNAKTGVLTARHYACDGLGVTVRTETFPPRVAPRPVLLEERRLTRDAGVEDVTVRTLRVHGLDWTLTQTDSPPALAASLLWENGAPVSPGLGFRLRRAWRSIAGGGGAPVLIVLTPDPGSSERGADDLRTALLAIKAFLGAAPNLAAALDTAAPAR